MNLQEWTALMARIKEESNPEVLSQLSETLLQIAENGGILGFIAMNTVEDAVKEFKKKDTVAAAREAGIEVNARRKEVDIVQSIKDELYK